MAMLYMVAAYNLRFEKLVKYLATLYHDMWYSQGFPVIFLRLGTIKMIFIGHDFRPPHSF